MPWHAMEKAAKRMASDVTGGPANGRTVKLVIGLLSAIVTLMLAGVLQLFDIRDRQKDVEAQMAEQTKELQAVKTALDEPETFPLNSPEFVTWRAVVDGHVFSEVEHMKLTDKDARYLQIPFFDIWAKGVEEKLEAIPRIEEKVNEIERKLP